MRLADEVTEDSIFLMAVAWSSALSDNFVTDSFNFVTDPFNSSTPKICVKSSA